MANIKWLKYSAQTNYLKLLERTNEVSLIMLIEPVTIHPQRRRLNLCICFIYLSLSLVQRRSPEIRRLQDQTRGVF